MRNIGFNYGINFHNNPTKSLCWNIWNDSIAHSTTVLLTILIGVHSKTRHPLLYVIYDYVTIPWKQTGLSINTELTIDTA